MKNGPRDPNHWEREVLVLAFQDGFHTKKPGRNQDFEYRTNPGPSQLHTANIFQVIGWVDPGWVSV